MNRGIMITLVTAGILALAAISAVLYNRSSFSNELRRLESSQKNPPEKIFKYDMISGLPQPVQRYFRNVLRDGQKYVTTAHMTHGGFFRTAPDKDWVDISGEQFYTVDTPGFIWRGKTAMFHAWDCYIAGRGSLTVYLFSFIRILRGEGPAYDQGELLRWLGEAVLYPTALLPSERISWTPVSSSKARVTLNHDNMKVYYDVEFSESGEIVYMETMRHIDSEKMEKWAGVCSNYREVNGMRIPMHIKGMWRLKTGDLEYARFDIEGIDYTY